MLFNLVYRDLQFYFWLKGFNAVELDNIMLEISYFFHFPVWKYYFPTAHAHHK